MATRTNVYVLRLLAGKFYVGVSKNPTQRIKQHFAGKGAGWTRTHSPVSVEAVYNDVDMFEEDMITKQLMAEKGIENVRGGFYVRNEISEPEQKIIRGEIWSATGVCMRCGRSGHYAVHCEHVRDVNGKMITKWDKCVDCGCWRDF